MRENKESEKGGSLIRMYNVSEHYKILEKVGRGTYGTVFKAKGLRDNKFYAIKKLENNDVKLQQEGFPITALRGTIMIVSEITLLKQIDHPNIIKLKEIILSRPSKRNLFRGSTFLVF
jgi:serine/threonine protein kinase